AWVPADQAAELEPLLAWIGAGRTVSHGDERFADLCLLDLPDYDSVERAHRATVDQVLPKVDALCWVLDPEKYNDRVLHEDYLRPLAHHAGRAVFALNRADTLGQAVGAVVADGGAPLVPAERRAAALTSAVAAALQAVDIDGVRTACVRRARAEARAAGAGPVGRVLGWLARRRQGLSADPDRSVDPAAYA